MLAPTAMRRPANAAIRHWGDPTRMMRIKGGAVVPPFFRGADRAMLRAMNKLSFDTPTGRFTLVESDDQIVAAGWGMEEGSKASPLLVAAQSQIMRYFSHDLQVFDLPLKMAGGLTGQVGALMLAIPLGETRTYGDLARDLAMPAQAIGQACGANPIPLIIPCHRILSASGLGGFSGAGGVETKVALLRHEGAAGLLI